MGLSRYHKLTKSLKRKVLMPRLLHTFALVAFSGFGLVACSFTGPTPTPAATSTVVTTPTRTLPTPTGLADLTPPTPEAVLPTERALTCVEVTPPRDGSPAPFNLCGQMEAVGNTGHFILRSPWQEGTARWGVDTYGFLETGQPHLMARARWEALAYGWLRHVIQTAQNSDGNLDTVLVDEIVPGEGAVFVPGSTFPHHVVAGEWLEQIARCYGADPRALLAANPGLGNSLQPGATLTVLNIGSQGKIYGPPCVATYLVQAGDTWNAIARQYNADPGLLQQVNANRLLVGAALLVPQNSLDRTAQVPPCVEVTRNFRLTADLQAPPVAMTLTLCGVPEQLQLSTIQIAQGQAGGFFQEIVVGAEIMVLNYASQLIVGDANYDGYDDFRLVPLRPALPPYQAYVYYIFDPQAGQFVYDPAYGRITDPEFLGQGEIRSPWRAHAGQWGVDTFTILNNVPELTRREMWKALGDGWAQHEISIFQADGDWQVLVDEIVPMP